LPSEDRFTFFTRDPRYRWRERIALGLFAIAIGLLILQRQELELRLLSWRLLSGAGEWDALFRLAEKGPDGLPYYADRIDDPDPVVRYKVLLCLKAMRHEAALPYLKSRMEDPDTDVRVNAFDAMAELGCREAVPFLIDALDDESHRLRRVAQNSLHMITGRTFDYDADSEREERNQAIARWQAWWDEEQG
jgi:hypothetical protein